MDSISNTYTSFYIADNVGSVQLKDATLRDLVATLYTELHIMENSSETYGLSTPQGVFHSTILEGLKRLGYLKIIEETADLVDYYFSNQKFGSNTVGASLGYMAKRSKDTFDIRFDLSFSELDKTMDECKLSLVIKAHRLFLAELCKKITRSYDPNHIDSGNAIYRTYVGKKEQQRNGKTFMVSSFDEHTSIDFIEYAALLKQVYMSMYAYSESLGEFAKIFVDAATASKQLSASFAKDRQTKTFAEQRKSPRPEKVQVSLKPVRKTSYNDTSVKTSPVPETNAWAQRQAEFDLVVDLVGSDASSTPVSGTGASAGASAGAPTVSETEYVRVSRKKAPAPVRKPKSVSRSKTLASINA